MEKHISYIRQAELNKTSGVSWMISSGSLFSLNISCGGPLKFSELLLKFHFSNRKYKYSEFIE